MNERAGEWARVHACMNGISFHPSYNTVEEWEILYYEWIKKNAHNTETHVKWDTMAREQEWMSEWVRVSKIWWHIICKANIFEKFICEHTQRWSLCKCQNGKGVGPIFKTNRMNEEKKWRTNEKKSKKNACKNGIVSSKRPSLLCCSWKYILCASQNHFASALFLYVSARVKHTITFEIRWWPFKHLIGIEQKQIYI